MVGDVSVVARVIKKDWKINVENVEKVIYYISLFLHFLHLCIIYIYLYIIYIYTLCSKKRKPPNFGQ